MSNPCWLTMTFRKEDQKKALEVFRRDSWDSEEEGGDPWSVRVEILEANYGLTDEREQLAAAGIAFYGQHGAGADYGDCAFAGCDGRHLEASTDSEGFLVTRVDDDDGTVVEVNLKYVRKFIELCKKAKAQVHADEVQRLIADAQAKSKKRRKSCDSRRT